MKRILAVVLLIAVLTGTLSACNQNSSTQESSSNTNTTHKQDFSGNISDNVSGMDSETTTTQAPIVKKLSDDCDKVLASGKDPNGDEWELVATEDEDYSGTTIKLGVIKNNEWVVPLTTECPFLEDDGSLCSGFYDIHEDDFNLFYYIGSSCFAYAQYNRPLKADIIWNVKTNKVYNCDDYKNNTSFPKIAYDIDKEAPTSDSYAILEYSFDGKVNQYIDLNTMEIKNLNKPVDYHFSGNTLNVFPISEGLFATYHRGSKYNCNGFYNINGEMVIDLNDYLIDIDPLYRDEHMSPALVFKNGKCSFNIYNDQGTEYIITIDKEGNVLESVKVES